ncbi:MAG: dihydroorotase family protein [Candidatus Aenigmarchaeota archaeon]|nr:dihydroorotase family protein [Candidatus Aenigmarchaeota archaeon]
MGLVLNGGKVFAGGKLRRLDVRIENGKIAEVGTGLEGGREIGCKNKLILPGAIDCHVHFRQPGMERKEDWEHGSRAAVAGGVTTVMDMPNSVPPTVSLARLEEKRRYAAKSLCDYSFHFGAAAGNISDIKKCGLPSVKIYAAETTASKAAGAKLMLATFRAAREAGMTAAVHAEDMDIIRANELLARNKGWNSVAYHSYIRSAESEAKAVANALAAQRQAGSKLHICHLSSAAALELMEEADRNLVSCEVTPHHLFLSKAGVAGLGNLAKVNPAIHSSDRKALLRALCAGAIDCVASDHAPHTIEEKSRPYWDAPSGAPGVETMLPLLLDACNRDMLAIADIVRALCSRPAEIFRLAGKGQIRTGFDADIAVVDMKARKAVENTMQQTKCKWTLFSGRHLRGWPVMTMVRGNIVYSKEGFAAGFKGAEVSVVRPDLRKADK